MRKSDLNYCFLLPLVWLNILFGNQVTYPVLIIISQIINWLIILNITFLFFKDKSSLRVFKLFCIILLILCRVISIMGFEQFYLGYLIFTFVVFVFAGNQFFNEAATLFKNQIIGFVIFCIPFMFLQIMGASSFFQVFNTLYIVEVAPGVYERPDVNMIPLLFSNEVSTNWGFDSDYTKFLSMQSRPPGLLHSSAMLAPVVLAAAFLSFTNLSRRNVFFVDIAIIVAIILTGAKIALYGYLFLLIIAGVKSRHKTKGKVISMICLLAFSLLLYSITFPDTFTHNHAFGAIQVSLGLRIIDVLQILGTSNASDIIDAVTFLSNANESSGSIFEGGGGLSGLIYIIYSLPVVILMFILTRPIFRKYYRDLSKVDPDSCIVMFLALTWSFLVLLATPLLGSAFYGLILGIGMSPLLNKRRNIQSLF